MALDLEDILTIILLFICFVIGSIILMLYGLTKPSFWFWILVPPSVVCLLGPCICIIYIFCTANNRPISNNDTELEPYKINPKDQKYQDRINLEHSKNQPECVICQDNVQSTLLSCGHANLCHLCAQRIKKSRGDCPICRRRIKDIEEEFFTQREYAPSRDSEAQKL